MSAAPAPDLDMIRDEIAVVCARVSAHATAAGFHADAGCDRGLAYELRCAAVALMSASALAGHLRPSQQANGRKAA